MARRPSTLTHHSSEPESRGGTSSTRESCWRNIRERAVQPRRPMVSDEVGRCDLHAISRVCAPPPQLNVDDGRVYGAYGKYKNYLTGTAALMAFGCGAVSGGAAISQN